MTETAIKQTVIRVLEQIAPGTEPGKLRPDDNIREKLELDSFDALRLIVALDEKLGVETPEEDYGKITTLRELIDYILQKQAQA